MLISIIIAIAIIAALLFNTYRKKQQALSYQLPKDAEALLLANVPFYNDLDDTDKQIFKDRIRDFLAHTTIRGVDTDVEDLDRILIASGAIMLIFSFPDWKYNNIAEVLLYKGAFNKEYSTVGVERNVLGMVGEGAMHREMILSKPSLRASFQNPENGENTVIHEFAHLIDKADGATDGVPEYLLTHPQLAPWMTLVHKQIEEIRKGNSDINVYGATNEAEFFAVVAEYFFEKPYKLKEVHPELFSLLDEMFHPKLQNK